MPQAPYDKIASEYYSDQHRTSRNFDETTIRALSEMPEDDLGAKVLELGAGRGRVGEFLRVEPERVVQLDSSDVMFGLRHREPCSVKVLGDARSIPLAEQQFSSVVGFLADPYLGLLSLSEAYRVLVPNGRLLITTPTYEWGAALRQQLHIDLMSTRFRIYAEDTEVRLPSYLYPKEQLSEMLVQAGFSNVSITDHTLPGKADPVSPDIMRACEILGKKIAELAILHVVRAQRR